MAIEERLQIYQNTNKIIYYTSGISPKILSLGDKDYKYFNLKINDLQEEDIKTIKENLNGKEHIPEVGSITIVVKKGNNTYQQSYISDKSKATKLNDILERVKNSR